MQQDVRAELPIAEVLRGVALSSRQKRYFKLLLYLCEVFSSDPGPLTLRCQKPSRVDLACLGHLVRQPSDAPILCFSLALPSQLKLVLVQPLIVPSQSSTADRS